MSAISEPVGTSTAFITNYIESNCSDLSVNPRFFIITGGPGVGKTSIINKLANSYSVGMEAAADVISRELSLGIETPWALDGFREKIVALQKQRQQELLAKNVHMAFFDRSPIDTMSYCLHFGAVPTAELQHNVQEVVREGYYSRTVFFIEHLGFTEQTEIRAEADEESLAIGEKIKESYRNLGFKIIFIPKDTIEERVKSILAHIESE
ncbi:MAG: AAA family ATPase [Chlamydiales bacterium]|nr:AAA family ATPase [Chlamydiales bacterium]